MWANIRVDTFEAYRMFFEHVLYQRDPRRMTPLGWFDVMTVHPESLLISVLCSRFLTGESPKFRLRWRERVRAAQRCTDAQFGAEMLPMAFLSLGKGVRYAFLCICCQ